MNFSRTKGWCLHPAKKLLAKDEAEVEQKPRTTPRPNPRSLGVIVVVVVAVAKVPRTKIVIL
jgi:hypothetical protein